MCSLALGQLCSCQLGLLHRALAVMYPLWLQEVLEELQAWAVVAMCSLQLAKAAPVVTCVWWQGEEHRWVAPCCCHLVLGGTVEL